MAPYRNTSTPDCTQQSTRLHQLVAWVSTFWAESLLGVYLVCLTLIWVACAALGSVDAYVGLHLGSAFVAAIMTIVAFCHAGDNNKKVSPLGVVGLVSLYAHWMMLLTGTALVQAFGG